MGLSFRFAYDGTCLLRPSAETIVAIGAIWKYDWDLISTPRPCPDHPCSNVLASASVSRVQGNRITLRDV